MKLISAEDLHRRSLNNPDYRREYEASQEEFALALAIIDARSRAGLTQAQLARRMKTTQTTIARLESGRVKPSTRTLERLAKATGHRLIIDFAPLGPQKARRRPSQSITKPVRDSNKRKAA